MRQSACNLCGAAFVFVNGMSSTTCNCARDKPDELAVANGRKMPRQPHLPLFYAAIFPALVEAAKNCGYALAVHGSTCRDFDLIAVPWMDEATDGLTLIKCMKQSIAAITHVEEHDHYFPDCSPSDKPHGRKGYSLHFTNRGWEGPYVDVSVIPRAKEPSGNSG